MGSASMGLFPTSSLSPARRASLAYIGDGLNRWPAAHRTDAARVYRLAIEHGAEGGPFHAVAEEGLPFKDIAEVIGPTAERPRRVAVAGRGGEALRLVRPLRGRSTARPSSDRTRSLLGWRPAGPGLIADIDAYFAHQMLPA